MVPAPPSTPQPLPDRTAHLEAARRLLLGRRPRIPSDGESRGRARARLGWAVDAVALGVVQHLFVSGHRKNLERTPDYRRLAGEWLELADEIGARHASFFPLPAPPPTSTLRLKKLPGGSLEQISFASEAYGQGRPGARELLALYPENARARARHYCHADAGHPAVIWLHGWGMGQNPVEATLSRARHLYGLGLDVYLYVQPYHGERRGEGARLGSTLHPSTNVHRTNEAFLQTAWEVRAIIARHLARGGGPCGVMGWSLGGYVAAMLASVAPELAFSIPMLPIADVPGLMWSKGDGTADRERAEAAGVTFEDFCRSMAVHAPLAHSLAIPPVRILLVGGRGDCIIPSVHTTVLWEHWGRPAIHWFPGGHLTHFGRRGYLERIDSFLVGLGLL